MEKRYYLSIETDTESFSINEFDNKAEAMKQARYFRTGGLCIKGVYKANENPNVRLYDAKKQQDIYTQPLFKYALKK